MMYVKLCQCANTQVSAENDALQTELHELEKQYQERIKLLGDLQNKIENVSIVL